MHRLAALVAALLLAACGGAAGTAGDGVAAPTGTPSAFETLRPGEPLPPADLPLLGEDGSVSTTAWRGTPTVLNFWATWCTYCIDEMPDLERAHGSLGDAVRFVGVDREDPDEAAALELARDTGVSYLLVQDPDGSFFRAVQGRGMPLTVLVDAEGTIRHRHAGPLTTERLLALVQEHLGVDAAGG